LIHTAVTFGYNSGTNTLKQDGDLGALFDLPTLDDPIGINVYSEPSLAGILTVYANKRISLIGLQAGPASGDGSTVMSVIYKALRVCVLNLR
jgi:hypothetical protein